MNVWKVIIEADDYCGRSNQYTFVGVASNITVAANQTLRLAKRQQLGAYTRVASVECLGELDFSTRRS